MSKSKIVTLVLVVAIAGQYSVAQDYSQLGLDLVGEAALDNSGWSVSASANGRIIAVGAPYNDGTGRDAGHVRIYEWNNESWVQRGSDLDAEEFHNHFGWSISLSEDGTIVAVGAPPNSSAGVYAGHVRVFEWNTNSWLQRGSDIDGDAGDLSGFSVSLSADGSIVAIGAVRGSNKGTRAGKVRVYEWNSSVWVQRGDDMHGEAEDDKFGGAVAMSSDGSMVAIGADIDTGPGSSGAGKLAGYVRVFEWNGSAWIQVGSDIEGEAAFDNFGTAVALSSSGRIVAIGGSSNDGAGTSAGHVRVLEWNGATWIQLGDDIDGKSSGERSGGAVSLSSDGGVVAIGAPKMDSGSGGTRIYEWNGTSWQQRGSDITGEAANEDFGRALSLSADGTVVAIGAIDHDGSGVDSGLVRVYQRTPTAVNRITVPELDSQAELVDVSTFPNPSRGLTRIVGNLATAGHVRITIHDLLGRTVATLHSGLLTPGKHEFVWDAVDANGKTAPNGIYLMRIEVDRKSTTKVMSLVR